MADTQPAEVVKEVQGTTTFGFGQLSNPTPKWAKDTYKWFLYVTGIITVALDIFTEIPPDIKLIINSSVVKANLLVHALTRLFGVDPSK